MSQGAAKVVAGRYTLVRPLGRGGMGVVWQARDGLLHRGVAVKEIYLPSAGDNPADPLMRRALREAQAAAQLRHPGIITVHDVVTDDGRPWIVMELIDGRSLAEVIRAQGVLSTWRAAQIGLRVLEALRAAHRQGILHRDVKPANILLDEDRVVLTDFGIAAIDGGTILTATGQMVGSPSYLSPERINGHPATAAADLWALGVTLYATVTGRPPFDGEDTQATLAAVLTSQPKPPAHAGQLWPVIKGLLVKDVDQRLTADQAAPLLASAAQPAAEPQPSRRRRRRFTPDTITGTAIAPPPTIAAPTDRQMAQGKKRSPGAKQPAQPTEADPVSPAPTTVAHQEEAADGPADPTTVAADTAAADTAAADAAVADTVAADTLVEPTAPQPMTVPAAVADRAVPVAPPARWRRTPQLTASTGGDLPADPRPQPGTGHRLLAVAAVAVIVALTVTVVYLVMPHGEGTAAQPPASSSAAASPSVSVSPSPSYRPGVDPCLLGTWRVTMNQAWGLIDSTRVLYTGGAGVLITYRADGTEFTDYSKMRPRTAHFRGVTWSDVHRGTVSGRYYAADGAITDTVKKSTAVDTVRRNGKVNTTSPVTFFPEPSQYRCTGDDLYTYSAQGNYSSQLVRVSGPKPTA